MGKLIKQLKLKDDAAAKKFLEEQFGSEMCIRDRISRVAQKL